MLTLQSILILMVLNFFADQVLQLKAVQLAKHQSPLMLAAHCCTHILWFIPFTTYIGYGQQSFALMFVWPGSILALHYMIEYIIGSWAEAAYKSNKIRMFILLTLLENFTIMFLIILGYNTFFWL
ncbi:MAG TPA: hypothetical protein ACFYEK_01255 [Candidatus Wunengus sp. YC60]|uniref:hypothetical protein n=1 Tax=Candidatus Wunengus sp. YC60 TaxID=3367697 RepID=UPI0040252043